MRAEFQPPRYDPRLAFLDGIRELPSLPQILVRVSRVASDPSSSAADLADVILKDQAMTLKVLRIANSAQYALYSQRVATVSRAVVLLGFESVRAMALGIGAFHLLSSLKRGGGILERFWSHAIATAVVSQDLAELLGVPVPEEAFVAGLLHDVGKLVLAEHAPDRAQGVYGVEIPGPELLRCELRVFGVTHVEVGEELARRWDLPDVLRKSVARHHRHFSAPPTDPGDRLAFLVGVAKTLAHGVTDRPDDPRDLAAKMARVIRKPVGSLTAVLQAVPAKIHEFAKFFEIQIDDLTTYTLWVEGENQRLQEAFQRQETGRRSAERRHAEMAAIREVHALLLEGATEEAVAARVLRACREAAGGRRVLFGRPAGLPPTVRPSWRQGDLTPEFVERFQFPLAEGGILAGAIESGHPVHVFDTQLPYFQRVLTRREAAAFDAPSFAVVPISVRGDAAGVLYADRQPGDEPFSEEEMETLATLANLLGLALRPS